MANKIFTNARGKKISKLFFGGWKMVVCMCFRIKQLANMKPSGT